MSASESLGIICLGWTEFHQMRVMEVYPRMARQQKVGMSVENSQSSAVPICRMVHFNPSSPSQNTWGVNMISDT